MRATEYLEQREQLRRRWLAGEDTLVEFSDQLRRLADRYLERER